MNILLVDDEQNSRTSVGKFLSRLGHSITQCSSGEEALLEFTKNDYPLILSDIKMPGLSGIDLLKKVKATDAGWKTDVVLFTGYGTMESAIAALRAGAYDFLLKPVSAEELAMMTDRIAEHQALLRENKILKEKFNNEVEQATKEVKKEYHRLQKIVIESAGLDRAVFNSSIMKDIFSLAMKYHTDRKIPILIEGETGTGKEIIARLIHYGNPSSPDTSRPFIDINCAALPNTLFESELFGYEAGAFTGSLNKGQKGKIESACGGTLFLDEISEIPIDLQSKLLRVIQEKEYYPIGGLKKKKVDVRIICATNVDLADQVKNSKFRKDLFFRLKVGHVFIPPLRERKEDIIALANTFLKLYSVEKHKKYEGIDEQAMTTLLNYKWPGNVRELKNVIEWAVFMHDDTILKFKHLSILTEQKTDYPEVQKEDVMSSTVSILLPQDGLSMGNIKRTIAEKVLAIHNGNKSSAARYLKISRRTLVLSLLKDISSK